MKLAYLEVFSKNKEILEETLEKLEIQNDTYLNSSSLIQEIYPSIHSKSLDFQSEMKESIRQSREEIYSELIRLEFELVKPSGGIHILFRIKKISHSNLTEEDIIIKLLKEHKIFIHPGYFYDYEINGYYSFVMSVLGDSNQILEALKTVKSICLQ
jgi:aspartate/methionine/tyrosine aminotransferase